MSLSLHEPGSGMHASVRISPTSRSVSGRPIHSGSSRARSTAGARIVRHASIRFQGQRTTWI
jgi:hypothetical protein